MAGDKWDLQHHRGPCLPLQGTFSFEFQPLRAGETCGRLALHNSDLGYYQYELNLKAMPALPEKPIHFQTVLGSGQSIFAKIINYTRQKTEYYCRVSSPCPTLLPFPCQKSDLKNNGRRWGVQNCEIQESQVLPPAWKLQLEVNSTRPGLFFKDFLLISCLGCEKFFFSLNAH